MRSSKISRLYIQVPAGERLEKWSDARIWDELQIRLGERGLARQRGPDPREGDHADADLRVRADAVRQPVPARRCRTHRPADRGQGTQPRGQRRAPVRRGACRASTPRGSRERARRFHRDRTAPGVARAGLLQLHDPAAARPRPRRLSTACSSSPGSTTSVNRRPPRAASPRTTPACRPRPTSDVRRRPRCSGAVERVAEQPREHLAKRPQLVVGEAVEERDLHVGQVRRLRLLDEREAGRRQTCVGRASVTRVRAGAAPGPELRASR